jgi:hypothetical protein
MRATQRRRSLSRTLLPAINPERLGRLAATASYVGSVEHKDTPSFDGRPPRPRPDATLCDRALADSRNQLTEWLRTAIAKGVIGGPWEGEFPRYAWYKTGGTVYEARLVNRAQGTYKGYGLLPDEWPKDIETHYE